MTVLDNYELTEATNSLILGGSFFTDRYFNRRAPIEQAPDSLHFLAANIPVLTAFRPLSLNDHVSDVPLGGQGSTALFDSRISETLKALRVQLDGLVEARARRLILHTPAMLGFTVGDDIISFFKKIQADISEQLSIPNPVLDVYAGKQTAAHLDVNERFTDFISNDRSPVRINYFPPNSRNDLPELPPSRLTVVSPDSQFWLYYKNISGRSGKPLTLRFYSYQDEQGEIDQTIITTKTAPFLYVGQPDGIFHYCFVNA